MVDRKGSKHLAVQVVGVAGLPVWLVEVEVQVEAFVVMELLVAENIVVKQRL